MQHQESSLDIIHDLILDEILLHLNPESIVSMRGVNKRLYFRANKKSLWRDKTKQHFPYRSAENINEFKTHYLQLYDGIPKHERKLFSFVKEGDIQNFKKKFRFKHLKLCSEYNGKNLLALAVAYKHQAILDCLYKKVKAASAAGKPIPHPVSRHSITEDVTLLSWAVLCNQPSKIIEKLLADGCDINQGIFWYGSPLTIAAQFNYIDLIKTLLKNNAKCVSDEDGSIRISSLATAIFHGNMDAIKILYDYVTVNRPEVLDQKFHDSELYMATQEDHMEAVRFLLEHGANINSIGPFGGSVLSTAIMHDCIDIARYLIENNIDVNIVDTFNNRDMPPIVAAAYKSQELVELLIKRGANINARTRNGATTLYVAVQENNIALVSFLLSHGADVQLCFYPDKDKFTPLTLASKNGSTEIISALIAKGANVNVATGSGMTPLHYAVQLNQIDAVRLLVKHGANVNAKCKDKTPLDIARDKKNYVMIQLLQYYQNRLDLSNQNNKSNLVNFSLLNIINSSTSTSTVVAQSVPRSMSNK